LEIREKVIDLVRNRNTDLPTLPVVMNNIIATARSEKSSARDLASFIVNDQAISARVLKIANSPYYGMCKEIDSVTRAIVVIGFKEIISLVLATGVFSAFSQKKVGALIDMTELWKHSIAVGFAIKKIGKQMGKIMDESAILIGLLHDIGKIIFGIYFPDEYAAVLKEAADAKAPLYKIEQERLGLDHAEIACLIMKQWNFPLNIIDAIRYHHSQFGCPEEQLYMAMMLNAADFICHQSSIGQSGNKNVEEDEEIITRLRFSDQDIITLVKGLETERPQIEYFLEALA